MNNSKVINKATGKPWKSMDEYSDKEVYNMTDEEWLDAVYNDREHVEALEFLSKN